MYAYQLRHAFLRRLNFNISHFEVWLLGIFGRGLVGKEVVVDC